MGRLPSLAFALKHVAKSKTTEVSKFSTGNLETLKLEPEKAGQLVLRCTRVKVWILK